MTEFYVGYLPKAPSGIARKMKVAIVMLFAAATTCGIGFAALQRTYARSFFESGKERTFDGIIEASPYPALLSSRAAASSSALRYLLVAKGKHGADSQVAAYVGKSVRLRGTLIYRLSGGIPPVFATNDFNGSPRVLLLTGPNQTRLPREAFLDRVAQPLQIHGRVMQIGNTLLLETESSAIASRSSGNPPGQRR